MRSTTRIMRRQQRMSAVRARSESSNRSKLQKTPVIAPGNWPCVLTSERGAPMTRRNPLTAIRLLAVIIAAYTVALSFAQKANVPIRQDVVALLQPKVIEVLFLMNADRNGKISKKDFMNRMEAVFDRLDKDRHGELDPRQFRQSVRVRSATGR